ncbi:MAG: hypothetical protein JWQ29_2369 [Phenylobacterium sp.]|nr:hypothetical protein [Phenylobacterium sp.]
MPPQSDDLAARLQRMEDERDIVTRLHAVCYAVDGPDEAAWLDGFTAGGVFTWRPAAGAEPKLDLRGQAALAEWFAGHRKNNPLGTQVHIVLHPIVSLGGDTARVKSTYVTLRLVEGEIVVASSGRYDDGLSRCADGAWRLDEHHSIGNMMRQPQPVRS